MRNVIITLALTLHAPCSKIRTTPLVTCGVTVCNNAHYALRIIKTRVIFQGILTHSFLLLQLTVNQTP